MELYKESLLNKIEDDLTGRNQNWDEIETHLADYEAHLAESAQKHITESGENTNGRYVKFDDGTMICTHKITITGDVSTTAGALFRGNNITWFFPAEFLNNNIGVSSSIGGQTQMFTTGNVVTTSTCSFYPTRATSLTNITYHIHFIAIGKWK